VAVAVDVRGIVGVGVSVGGTVGVGVLVAVAVGGAVGVTVLVAVCVAVGGLVGVAVGPATGVLSSSPHAERKRQLKTNPDAIKPLRIAPIRPRPLSSGDFLVQSTYRGGCGITSKQMAIRRACRSTGQSCGSRG
jgi:hypothetical protein